MSTVCPKCEHVRTQKDDLRTQPGQCPACGIFYEKFLKRKVGEQKKQRIETAESIEKPGVKSNSSQFNRVSSDEKMLAHLSVAEHKTNHILHLLISLFTITLWIPVWLFIATSNTSKRNKIKRDQGMPTEKNIPIIFAAVFFAFVVIGTIVAK